MRRLVFFVLFFLLSLSISFSRPVNTWAATYSIPTSTTTVDGSSYCGGKSCKGGDTLIIKGGSREGLLLSNFNGQGTYITVTNESTNPDKPVIMDQGPTAGFAILSISNCKWLDVRGDNDPGLKYGIKVNNGAVGRSAAIHVYGKSEHVKIGYTEVSFDNNTGKAGSGIRVQDTTLNPNWIFDDIEIHNNYIHDSKYAGMYLGHNKPPLENNPYTANFLVHHNIIENSGAYAMTLKGMMGPGVSLIYENIIDTTGVNPAHDSLSDVFHQGIGSLYHYNGATVKIYKNKVINTVGPGIRLGTTYTNGVHMVYENEILGCGTGNDAIYGNGITVHGGVKAEVNNNIIIQPARYGILVKASAKSVEVAGNLIGDAGINDMLALYQNDALKRAPTNIYYKNVQDFNFTRWSDDGRYDNDIFTLNGNVGAKQILAPKDLKIEAKP